MSIRAKKLEQKHEMSVKILSNSARVFKKIYSQTHSLTVNNKNDQFSCSSKNKPCNKCRP